MAREFPRVVARIEAEGHTIGSHTETHPLPFAKAAPERAQREIADGIATLSGMLADPGRLAPFFRFPGLGRSSVQEVYLRSRSLSVWSTDVVADDWIGISPGEVAERALARLDRRGGGILLLHDIQRRTVAALPIILSELARRRYQVVHVRHD
jgi:peptidoglycan/xylan/chitin deacetylase (PgdA/CDA1 family)